MDIKDIQEILDDERSKRFKHTSDLANLVIAKIAQYLQSTDTTFPFHHEKMCFEIAKISKDLSDVEVKPFTLSKETILKLSSEELNTMESIKDIVRKYEIVPDNNFLFSNPAAFQVKLNLCCEDSLYNLNLNSTEWGMFFKELELNGFQVAIYSAETFEPSNIITELTSDWMNVTKVVIFLDTPF